MIRALPKLSQRALLVAGVGAVLALAIVLRAADPLANPVMAAEDPYTHMSLVREHLRDGQLDPLVPDGVLYPPGMHAVLGAMWVYSGMDLYPLLRFAPVAFGAMSVLGIAFVLGRWEGAFAALGGGLALALMPEEVFRTAMAAPTALDLALLPALIAALIEVVQGRLRWAWAAAPLALFLVLAHPWVLAIVAATLAGYVLLALLVPWDRATAPAPQLEGIGVATAIVGVALGFALVAFWTDGGVGPGDLAARVAGMPGSEAGVMVALLAIAVGGALFVSGRHRASRPRPAPQATEPERRASRARWMRLAGVACMALALVAMAWPAVRAPTPNFVDLPRMVGWPALLLAGLALLLLPYVGSPAAHAGAALLFATMPLTLYNPLESAYWPHRTVAYLGLGVALLAGVAVGRIARHGGPLLALWGSEPSGAPPPEAGSRIARAARPIGAIVLVALVLDGAIVGATPPPYPGGWYRYFDPCEFDALRDTAALANAEPQALLVTGSWQAKLVVAAFTEDASRVWYKPELFQDPAEQANFTKWVQETRPVGYVVVDRYLLEPQGNDSHPPDVAFLQQAPWERVREACTPEGGGPENVTLYAARGGGTPR